MLEYNYGRAKVTVELAEGGKVLELSKYDIVVSDIQTGEVIGMTAKGLRQRNELSATQGYRFETAVELAQRYSLLMDTLDMANHNKMCYSTSYSMEQPKENYSNEWHKEHDKIKLIEAWIKDLKSKYPIK